jgi:hypothetical protein
MEALTLTLVIAAQAAMLPNSKNLEAANKASQAFYKQSGMDVQVDAYGRSLVPDKVLQARISNVAILTKTLLEQRITLTWSF